MKEMVSPEQSQSLVMLFSLFLALLGGGLGWRTLGPRGLAGLLLGPLTFGLWQFHVWITRYDPNTGYFGLDKVKVWIFEVFLFVALGTALGIFWGRLAAVKSPSVEKN
jgi:hypothetical protein